MRYVWLAATLVVVIAGVLHVWPTPEPATVLVTLPSTCPSLPGLPDPLSATPILDDDDVIVEVQCGWGPGPLPPLTARYRVSTDPDEEARVTAHSNLIALVARKAHVELRVEHMATTEQSEAQAAVAAWARVLLP